VLKKHLQSGAALVVEQFITVLLLWREIPAGSSVFLVVREAGTSAILAGD